MRKEAEQHRQHRASRPQPAGRLPGSAGSERTARDGGVQSVERALMLLEVLGAREAGCRLTDLARATGLSPSTVHRLLTTLEKRRFVQFDRSDGRWQVGRQAFSVGTGFLRKRNVVAPALPFLRQLRDATRETANLGVMEDGEILTLAQAESREIMRAIAPVGGRVPATASAMGKAILATYDTREMDVFLARHPLRPLTSHSILTRQAFLDELATIRRRGHAYDNEEFMLGLRCVAAVVYNHMQEAAFAISISGLAARMTDERLPALGELVATTAARLTWELDGRAPKAPE